MNESQAVEARLLHNNAKSYTTSFVEGGFTGGFQALVAEHFVIDPEVQIGMELPHTIYNTETEAYSPGERDIELLFSITFGVGYRF